MQLRRAGIRGEGAALQLHSLVACPRLHAATLVHAPLVGAGLPAKRTPARALAGKSIHKENCRGIGNGGAGFIGGVAVAFLVAPRQDGPGF
jgi:homoserine dehydrogenase